jgi:hypothetical protein
MNQLPETPQTEPATKLPFVILALLGLGLIGYCIFGAIALLQPQQTAPKTEVATGTANQTTDFIVQTPSNKAQVLMDESAQWDIVFEDTFDSDANVNGWNYGEVSVEQMDSNLEVKDGKYNVFLINDQYVYELTDNEIKNGGFGYGVGLYQADLHNTFEFDNFIIQAP